jgi:hypothetical protein
MVEFATLTAEEMELEKKIVDRALLLGKTNGIKIKRIDLVMDLEATHKHCPLDFAKLADADDGTFVHDIFGIRRYLNRETGYLGNCFVPRTAK